MLSARAGMSAARRRGFIAGSGRTILAATVISRASLPNTFDLIASCRPLRCMMFLNWEWPAKRASSEFVTADFGARYRSVRRGNPHSDLILRRRRSRRLEGWPPRVPPFETHRGACHRAGHFGPDPLAMLLTVRSVP